MALIAGGSSGFNAVYGGGRTDKSGEYLRLDAHGFRNRIHGCTTAVPP
jgi:hypothetical protein